MSDLPLLDAGIDGDEPDPAPPRGSRRGFWITLGVLLIVTVTALGALGWHLLTAGGTTLRTPTTVAGLRHDTTTDATQTADYLRDALSADVALRSSVGAVYTDPASADRTVLLFGGTGDLSSPVQELDRAIGLLDDGTGAISGLGAVPAGPMGGTMKCGTSNGDGGPMAVCGWADHASLVVGLFPGRPTDQAADLLRQIRAAMQH